MVSGNVNNGNMTVDENEGGFDFRGLIDAVILHWKWFVVSVMVCVACAFLYIKTQHPVYTAFTKVLIKEEDPYQRSMRGSALADFSQLGFMTNSNGFDNEVEILGSKNLAKRTVTNLKLNVTYAYDGLLRDEELYGNAPLVAELPAEYMDTLKTAVFLSIAEDDGGFLVEGIANKEEFEAHISAFPAKVETASGWVQLTAPGPVELDGKTLNIAICNPGLMADAILSTFTIEPTSKMTTIALLSMQETQTQRALDYLNELIRVYNEDANEIKNEVAVKTEAFIDGRIEIIDRELSASEIKMETFKKQNNLVDLSADARSAYTAMENYQEQQIEVQIQMMLVKSLKDYVDNPDNYMEIIPANLGLTNAPLVQAISDYNESVLARKRMLNSASETSPAVVNITNEIASMYPAIRHSLNAFYDNLSVQRSNLEEQFQTYVSRLYDAPTQERILAEMVRQQAVKATLFEVLLQKREENAISLASTVDKALVVEYPEASIYPVAPRKKIILLIALMLGCGFPIGVIYLINLLRYRIEGRNDVEKLTSIPVLADIFVARNLQEGQRAIVVKENSNDVMEETFRNLRTNLSFVMNKSEKVLLCTSMIPGEGKTFVSTNLAMSMALMGLKVLVIGLDVRKPRLAKLFGIQTGSHGITTYLAGDENTEDFLRSQIFKAGVNPNLDVMPSGLIPPNPGELIVSPRLDQAFEQLRKWYDMIIVDTPPVGLVADTVSMSRVADATLLVCRCDYSLKRNFAVVNEYAEQKKLPKVNLVLNGVDLQQRKYGYYYGYGGYGKYGRYGSYGTYGVYGGYGGYAQQSAPGGSKRKGGYVREDSI